MGATDAKKKSFHASERDTERVQRLRVEYWHTVGKVKLNDLVFVDEAGVNLYSPPAYWYRGRCPRTGEWVQLPRTQFVEAIAEALMQDLAADGQYAAEGKMYGVLLVETGSGEKEVLKAFSGLLQGKSQVEGWVPPIPGREQIEQEEVRTLARLEELKQELMALQQIPARSRYADLSREFEVHLQQLSTQHSQRKQERQHQRQTLLTTLAGEALATALASLDDQSRRDGMERRDLKRQRDQVLQPLKQVIDQADGRMRDLKHQRQQASRQLQAEMHAHYWLTNFAGLSLPLQQLIGGAMPTGTGDCCAPKLLHYAATHRLKPLAMAEFWWGAPGVRGDKVPGEFYGACAERCQPLMGFLLSGLMDRSEQTVTPIALPIIYEDEWLIAIEKPPGLLSVPGRYRDRQDSALNRLRALLPDGMKLMAVHRLDQDTSGILLFARDLQTYRHLSHQFQTRQVRKVYEAMVTGVVEPESGVIELPLWADPSDRPYQKVDCQRGKPSTTQFQVLAREASLTRMECIPLTGRTHQIRVHAAAEQGLGHPILGDRLYGSDGATSRLHLHARELWIAHPQSNQWLHLKIATPF